MPRRSGRTHGALHRHRNWRHRSRRRGRAGLTVTVARSPVLGVGILLAFIGSFLALSRIMTITGWSLVTMGVVLIVAGIVILHKKNAEVRSTVSHARWPYP